jgi:hypothetical protein
VRAKKHERISAAIRREPDLGECQNNRQFRVSLSRPRLEARIYTDSIQRMRLAVTPTQEKDHALDVVLQQQRHRQPAGLRI